MISELDTSAKTQETLAARMEPAVQSIEASETETYVWDKEYYAQYVPIELVKKMVEGWQDIDAKTAMVYLDHLFNLAGLPLVSQAMFKYQEQLDLVMHPVPTFDSLKKVMPEAEFTALENDLRAAFEQVVRDAAQALSIPTPQPEVESHI